LLIISADVSVQLLNASFSNSQFNPQTLTSNIISSPCLTFTAIAEVLPNATVNPEYTYVPSLDTQGPLVTFQSATTDTIAMTVASDEAGSPSLAYNISVITGLLNLLHNIIMLH
jgi:hypothetical protein